LLYLVLQTFVWRETGLHTPMVGASGAIYGLLMAYGLMFGERQLLFMMVFPMKAKYFVWILAGIELMTTVFSRQGGLASAAHLGGMLAGFGYLWGRATYAIAQRKRKEAAGKPKPRRRPNSPKHLKLVINNQKKVEFHPSDDDENPPTFH
jgi:membrane associated rhomboid family serine protease